MDTSEFQQLKINYLPVCNLRANPHNARKHPKKQIRKLAASIRRLGFNTPIVVDKDQNILAGHGRWEAAALLGIELVPVVIVDLTGADALAFMLADNRLSELAEWDTSILSIELQHLNELPDFDVTITGFDVPEIDLIVGQASAKPDKDDVFEANQTAPAVTQLGDLWQAGKHWVLCGNSLQEMSFVRLMRGKKANVVFADPPFNVPISGHASGNGSIHHREFAMASGEMSEAEFVAFLNTIFRLLVRHSVSGSVHFVCMDWRHMSELLAAGRECYDSLLNLAVWVKDNGGMGSFYRSRHELIFVFRNGTAQHRNNVQLGKFGRNRSNVWEFPSVNTISRKGEEDNLLALHPTVKPVALVADALLDCSARGDIVLDPFLGSGSTLIAAERVGRICYGIEIDPIYVDTAIRRWQRHTGDDAIHSVTGKTFGEMAAEREATHE